MAGPAQRLQIGIVVCTATRFGYDVVDAGRFGGDAMTPAVLAQIFIALEDSGAADFPGATVAPFMPAFPALVVAPAVASMLLPVSIAIAAGIVGYRRTPPVAAWAFRPGWH